MWEALAGSQGEWASATTIDSQDEESVECDISLLQSQNKQMEVEKPTTKSVTNRICIHLIVNAKSAANMGYAVFSRSKSCLLMCVNEGSATADPASLRLRT